VRSEHARGWHSRGYLPHFDGGSLPQFITFRLAQSIPGALINRWRAEMAHLPPQEESVQIRQRVEAYLDSNSAVAWLCEPTVGHVVEESLLHFDGERYHVHAWVIMPNHVHVLMTPAEGYALSTIVQAWKSYSARTANRLLGRDGSFWYHDYFDRSIRDERHLAAVTRYIDENPVKAGLCVSAGEWSLGSARLHSAAASDAGQTGTSQVGPADTIESVDTAQYRRTLCPV
jgi:REP element-mobilizing transposase RayT